jgi:hypothetical protein
MTWSVCCTYNLLCRPYAHTVYVHVYHDFCRILRYKHIRKETLSIQQLQGSTSAAGLLPSSRTPQQSITNEAWQTNHPTQALYSSPCSSVGTLMPAWNPVSLEIANIPKHARYMKKLPLRSPTLISHSAPATKDARVPYVALQTHNKRDAKHSAAPREHIHSRTPPVILDTPANHHERGMANKPPHAGTLHQPYIALQREIRCIEFRYSESHLVTDTQINARQSSPHSHSSEFIS